MQRLAFTVLALTLVLTIIARADERIMQWDNGQADSFAHETTKGHYIHFTSPTDWEISFPVSVMFYGKRYGDVGERVGTIVIWGPQSSKTSKIEDSPESLVIYTRKQFPLKDVPTEPGWVTVQLDSVQLPKEFGVAIFTNSTEEAGVDIGLTAKSGMRSHSASTRPDAVSTEEIKEDAKKRPEPYGRPKPKPSKSAIQLRSDGSEWLIRIKVRPTLEEMAMETSAELSGPGFAVYDDGTADGYVSVQKYGPMLHVRGVGRHKVDRVYLYAQAKGDWFNTDRAAGVYLLDSKFAIIYRAALPYNRYTNIPGWSYVSMNGIEVPGEYYVLIEPMSRPGIELLIGYDASGANQASEFGTVGARLGWGTDAPEEKTNWMIRVRYK